MLSKSIIKIPASSKKNQSSKHLFSTRLLITHLLRYSFNQFNLSRQQDKNSQKKITSDLNLTSFTRIQSPVDLTKRNCSTKRTQLADLCIPRQAHFDFEAVAGLESVVANLGDIVRYLRAPDEYKKMNITPPKGFLLYGAPGTGKTMLAEALAGHANVPFFLISGSQLVCEYVGESERLIRELFNNAEKNKACVLCIDEIDSIGEKRFNNVNSGGELHHNTMVNQLLSLLTQKSPEVILIATTNKQPHELDAALTRPGRFDRHIFVPLPTQENRKNILALHTKSKQLDTDVDLHTLARLSRGFSGAKLAAWVNEAAILAMNRGAKKICIEDFDKARMFLEVGLISTESVSMDKKTNAIHEAGHALVAHLLGQQVHKVSIFSGASVGGYTEILPEEKVQYTKENLLDKICVGLAGRAAEKINGYETTGNSDDISKAKAIAEEMVCVEGMGETISGLAASQNIEIILQEQMKRANELLEKNKEKFDAIVNALLIHQTLRYVDLVNVIARKPIDPPKYSQNLHTFMSIPISGRYIPSNLELAKALQIDVSFINFTRKKEDKDFIIIFESNMASEIWEDILKQLTKKNIDYSDRKEKLLITISSKSYTKFAELIKNNTLFEPECKKENQCSIM